jgi:Mor family transcriptional regulator
MNDILRQAAAKFPGKILAPFDELYKRHGFDAVQDVVHFLGGFTLYIPKMRAIFRAPVEACAKYDWLYNNLTVADLTKKYGFNEKYWRHVMYRA